MALTPEHGEQSVSRGKTRTVGVYTWGVHIKGKVLFHSEARSGPMDAQFTAQFCLLHILPFPQLFSLLFFSKEINSKCLHSF